MGATASPATRAGPRYAAAWAALVYALATLSLGYPALAGGFLVSGVSDQYIGGYAVREFGHAMLVATGHFPMWNPYLFGGMPYVASMNGDIFYPPSILMRLTLRPDVAVTWLFIVHIFLAGWLTYVFLRTMRLEFAGSLVGGLAYLMGGPIASYVSPGHDGKLYVSALLPLGLTLLVKGIRDGRPWAWPCLALTVGFAILSPHPQLLQYMLLGLGAFALYLAFWSGPGVAPSRPVALRRLGGALAAVVVGLAMGAVQFLPVIQYVAWSPRAGGGRGGYEFAGSYSMPPEELLNTYLPQFTGILDHYWGRTLIHFHSEYLGAVVLVLMGCAFFGTRPERRLVVRYWLIVAIVATLWTLGSYTPFYHLVYALVPGTKYFRAPSTMFFMAALAVAVLAGEGVENARRGTVPLMYLWVWIAAAAGLALLAAGGALTTIASGLAIPQMADRVPDNAAAVTVGAVRCLLFVLLTAAFVALLRRRPLGAGAVASVFAVLVAADLWTVEKQYWAFSPPASITYASDAAIDYVRQQPQPGRVIAAELGPGAAPRDPALEGDALMIHRLRQAIGYHSNEFLRYDMLGGKAEGWQPIFTAQLWRLLNIRFLYTNVGTLPVPGAQLVAGPVRDAAGTTVYLFRLPGDDPVAWVTPASVKAGDEQALVTVRDPRFDPTAAAIYDSAAPVAAQHLDRLPTPLGIAVTATRYDPGHMTFRLERPAPAGASLVVSENYYTGWDAKVDGTPATAARADYTLIGVPLPAGATTVDLVFRSRAFAIGAMVTLGAALVALMWLGASVLWRPLRHG